MRKLFLITALLFLPNSVSGQTFELRHDHSNILVSDLKASGQFYMDILKLQELETPWGENPKVRFFSIGNDRQIHMVQVDKEDIAINKILHLAFNVKDLEAYLAFLKKKGIEYFNFSGDKYEVQLRQDGVKQIYFQDPDGNWIEVNDAKY